mmetsp:Transcript_37877/g.90653  ORF Transcript_37877/g.90653 Transcript_37877/m.90653 type:complete len:244 (+) Transcript_37877:321-1052(+)
MKGYSAVLPSGTETASGYAVRSAPTPSSSRFPDAAAEWRGYRPVPSRSAAARGSAPRRTSSTLGSPCGRLLAARTSSRRSRTARSSSTSASSPLALSPRTRRSCPRWTGARAATWTGMSPSPSRSRRSRGRSAAAIRTTARGQSTSAAAWTARKGRPGAPPGNPAAASSARPGRRGAAGGDDGHSLLLLVSTKWSDRRRRRLFVHASTSTSVTSSAVRIALIRRSPTETKYRTQSRKRGLSPS